MTTVEVVPWNGPWPARDRRSDPAPSPDEPASTHLVAVTPAGTFEPVALYRRFVEELVAQRSALTEADNVGVGDHDVDWHAIWTAGEGAQTPEQAVGRVILAAHRVATGRSLGPATVVGSAPPAITAANQAPTTQRAVERPAWSVAPEPARFEREAALAPWRPATVPPTWVPAAPVPALARPVEDVPAIVVAPPVARGMARLRRRQKLANAFGWVRNIGIVIILFAAWQVWGTSIAQHQAQQALGAQFRSHAKSTVRPAGGIRLIGADVRVPQPPEGSVVAHLQIPTIGVDQYVVEGTGEGDLAKGPGHYVGTAMPGQAGNVAIAGHRTTYGAPFNQLNALAPGDPITLATDSGETLTYVVTKPPVAVSPNDVGVLNAFGTTG